MTTATTCSLTIPSEMYSRLSKHLFPGDGDEHGAVIVAGVAQQGGRMRLLARELFLAKDGVDYVAGKRGYRMLKAEFLYPLIRLCRDQRLAYIAIHNHGGFHAVEFSGDDYASHERGYPALLDIANGMPVGGLVLARHAVAGDIWLPGGSRVAIDETRVLGANVVRLYSAPPAEKTDRVRPDYDRQLQMFGAPGQRLLREAKVGVIGVGGVGSLLVEYLSRLGVGHLIIADPDRVEVTNLSRLVGATRWDALAQLQSKVWPAFVRKFAARHGRKKVKVARRVALQANPDCRVTTIEGNFAQDSIAKQFLDCDFLFLAADTMQARLVFNAMCQQFYIPGIQIGSKVVPGAETGTLEDVFGVTRWVTPGGGCLWCSGAISPHQLALEAKTNVEREDQDYGTKQSNPSVITLNAVGASHAVNDFLHSYLGLFNSSVTPAARRMKHLDHRVVDEVPRPDKGCLECGTLVEARFGRGDSVPLPTFG